jgi:hypothetical protein
MFNIFILLYLSVVYTVANPERCNTIIAQSSISNNECSELKVCYDTLCGCGTGLFMTTECQQWKKRYQTDTTCKVQCGAAQEVISGKALPPSITLRPPTTPSSGRRLAYDDPGTDYSNANATKSIIYYGPASDSLQFVDFLLCLLENTVAHKHVNKGAFIAEIDETLCEPAENGRPLWMSITLDVSRASNNDDTPMTIKGWVTTAEGEYVIFEASVEEAPSVSLPNGVFSLTYNFVPNWDSLVQGANAVNPTRKGKLEFQQDGTLTLIDQFVDDSEEEQKHYIKGSSSKKNSYRVFNGEKFGYVLDSDHVKIGALASGTNTCWSMSNADIFGDCQTKLYDSETGAELKLKEAFEFTTANGLNGWWNHRTPTHETDNTKYQHIGFWYEGLEQTPVIKLNDGDTITRTLDNREFTIQGMDWTVTGCDYSDAENACKSHTPITLKDSNGETFVLDAPISLFLGQNEVVTATSDGYNYKSFEYARGELVIFTETSGVFASHECSDGNFPPNWIIPVTTNAVDNCVKWRRIFHIKDGTLLHTRAARVDATGDTCVFASGAATCTNPDDGTSCNAHITDELTCTTTDGVNTAREDATGDTCVFAAATGATCTDPDGDTTCNTYNADSVTCRWTVGTVDVYRVKNAECTNFIKQLPEGTTDCSSLDINDVPEVVTSLEVPDITSGFLPPPVGLEVKYKHGIEQ